MTLPTGKLISANHLEIMHDYYHNRFTNKDVKQDKAIDLSPDDLKEQGEQASKQMEQMSENSRRVNDANKRFDRYGKQIIPRAERRRKKMKQSFHKVTYIDQVHDSVEQ